MVFFKKNPFPKSDGGQFAAKVYGSGVVGNIFQEVLCMISQTSEKEENLVISDMLDE